MENLVFERVAPASTSLVFGDTLAPISTDITIVGTLPALTVSVLLIPPVEAEIVGVLPALTVGVVLRPSQPVVITGTLPTLLGEFALEYHTNTQRPEVSTTKTFIEVAVPTESGNTPSSQHALKTSSGWDSKLAFSAKERTGFTSLVDKADNADVQEIHLFQDGVPTRSSMGGVFEEAIHTNFNYLGVVFQDALKSDTKIQLAKFEEGLRDRRPRVWTSWKDGKDYEFGKTTSANLANHIDKGRGTVFQDAKVPPPGISPRPVIPVVPPLYVGTAILFMCPPLEAPYLVFGALPCSNPIIGESITIPIRRVYIVVNSASLTRVDGGINIPVLSMSLSLDSSSWAWAFTATTPKSALSNLEPSVSGAPVEVEATINGQVFRFLVESISVSRSFGNSSLSVSGRGRTALLDAPYAPVLNFNNTVERTANQLMDDVLLDNGVPMGWTIVWNPEDWLVPANSFSVQSTRMGALKTIAGSVGGFILPHAFNKAMTVNLLYPSVPWGWSALTPDIIIPASVAVQESIAWEERARYNRVYVSGTKAGVLGQVTIDGTAGDMIAPMVTDSLITTAAAARQRGLAVLGETGRVARVSLNMPVMPSTGIIVPGKLIRYTDGAVLKTGMSRSVSVEVGMPQIRQTIEIETYVQ